MELQAEADCIDVQRRRLWQDGLGKLQDRRSSALHRLEEDMDETSSAPSLVSSHRLGPDDIHRCADFVDSVRSSQTLVGMREQLLQSAEEADKGMQDLLRQLATGFEKPLPIPPDWVRAIALSRELFYGTAVYQTIDEGGEITRQICMPLIALQNPYVVVWLSWTVCP